MAITKEQRAAAIDVLENGPRMMKKTSEIPEKYRSLKEKCEEKQVLDMPPTGGWPFRLYLFKAKNRTSSCPVFINVHGGGFYTGHLENDDYYSMLIADSIRGIVVDVDYTTTQEDAPFPTALEQCCAAVRCTSAHCLEWGGDPRRISMGGYSAGASLTIGTELKMQESGGSGLCLNVLAYPQLDGMTPTKYKTDGLAEGIPLVREEAYSTLYSNNDDDVKMNPYFSPIFASDRQLKKMPRTMILSAGKCKFRYENEQLARRLIRLGVRVDVRRFTRSRHGFMPHFMDEYESATDFMIWAIRGSSSPR